MTTASAFRAIRRRLDVSQSVLGRVMDCSKMNIALYERGQRIPSERAKLLIAFANGMGLAITFDHVYGDAQLPNEPMERHGPP